MYRRYSQANGPGTSLTQIKRNRIKDLLILVLIAMLVAGAIITIPAMQQKSDSRSLYIQRVQSECDDAIRQTSLLSRNAGADSASMLAKIRSNLYAIRAISSLYEGQGNGVLVQEEKILTLQNMVDRYLSYLTTGMDTGDYQTSLQNALEELRETLGNLH